MADEKDDSVPEIHLDPQVVQEMRRQGMDKPAGLPWSKWREPEELNHRHDEIISLMLEGRSKRYIADCLGMTYQYIVTITNSPIFKTKYMELRRSRNMPVDKKRLQDAFETAVDVLNDVMMNPEEKGSVRADVAKYMIDQSVGKPSGEVVMKSAGLIEVIHKLDEMRNVTETKATPLPVLDTAATPADALLNELIQGGFTVGKKKDEEPVDVEIPEADS